MRGFESLILCHKKQIPIWVSAFYFAEVRDSNNLNAARMSAAGDGLTEPLLNSIESLIRPSFGNLPRKGSYRGRIHDLSDASGTDVDGRSFWVVVVLESANCAVLGIRDSNQLNATARWRQHLNFSFPKGKKNGNRIPHPTKFRQSPERAAARGRIHDLLSV